MMKKTLPKISVIVLVAVILLTTGCNPFHQDPEQTVTITVTSISKDDKREEVLEILKGMTGGSGHTMSVRTENDQLIIKLSPITDVQGFARRINFGHVEKVDNRTILIEYVKYKPFI